MHSEPNNIEAVAEEPGIVVCDGEGMVQYINAAARRLLGASPDTALTAATLQSIRSRVDRLPPEAVGAWFEVGAAGDDVPHPGRRPLRVSATRDRAGNIAMLLRGGQRALDDELYLATRFRSLQSLSAGAAHDLRGPLNNIVVNLELLKHALFGTFPRSGSLAESPQAGVFAVIQQEVQRLNREVQSMLDLVAVDDEDWPVDLAGVLRELERLLRATTKLKRVRVELDVPEKPVFVIGRKDRLRQLFVNIVLDAMGAMPDGGRLSIHMRGEAGFAVVRLCHAGMPGEQRRRADDFDLHYTAHAEVSGAPLYVAARLAAELGGSVSKDGESNADICFTVRLPGSVEEQA